YKGNNTCENNGLEIIAKNEATGSTESIKYNNSAFDRRDEIKKRSHPLGSKYNSPIFSISLSAFL
ncbi:2594_t:CDS:1, partial [Ambispora gerdemannii]